MSLLTRKFGEIRLLARHARPVLPLVMDSLRQRSRPYQARHLRSGLTYDLEPGTGDWFTFLECCVRQDYFRAGQALQECDTVLDIGGNFGAFATMAARRVGPSGHVHCYEPSPLAFQRIEAHVALNGLDNVTCINAAVGGQSGTATLHLNVKSALSSLYDGIDGRNLQNTTPVEVQLRAIGDVMAEVPGDIALAKIDCEGAEFEIMEQITSADLVRIRTLVMETHRVAGQSVDTIHQKLRDHGFHIVPGNPFYAFNPKLG